MIGDVTVSLALLTCDREKYMSRASARPTYVGSEVLRSREKDDDDGGADGQETVRESQRHHDDNDDQPRPVGRLAQLDARR